MSFDIPFRDPLPNLVLMLFIKILDHVIIQNSICCLYFLLTCLPAHFKVNSYFRESFSGLLQTPELHAFHRTISYIFVRSFVICIFVLYCICYMLGFKMNWKGNSFVQCLQRFSTNLFHVRLLLDMFFLKYALILLSHQLICCM